jgi:GntR family transcriptional regulator
VSALLTIDPRHHTPIHVQLEHGIRAAIAAGRVRPGDQLPTVRQLAVDLQINANTVARVYGHLERLGVLETHRGVGTFVAARPPAPPTTRGHRDPDLRAIVRRCLDEATAKGFSTDDVVRQLKELAGKQGG